ncbi:MAG: cytochrome c [Bacteroidota bacterium]
MNQKPPYKRWIWFVWPLVVLLGLFLWQNFQGGGTAAGAAIYTRNCASCHMDDGTGLGNLIPALPGSAMLKGPLEELTCLIRYGSTAMQADSTVNVPPAQVMPPNPKLQPQQLVQLINFLRKTWSQESPSVGLEEVELSLEACPDSPAPN